MAMQQQFLALDLGAESGRGILGAFDGERLSLEEVGRFATGRGQDDTGPDGVRRWDITRIGGEIESLLAKAQAQAGTLHGVGVDTWGVDFGLLDAGGKRLEAPTHYRDERHPVSMAEVHSLLPPEEIWAKTGVQFMPFNTLYQLHALQARNPGLLDRAAHLLLMPDLFHHQLTQGRSLGTEMTNASTTQLFNPATRQWEPSLLTELGLPLEHKSGSRQAAFPSLRQAPMTPLPPSLPHPPRRGHAGPSYHREPGPCLGSSCPNPI
jgi:rhamnulokinase